MTLIYHPLALQEFEKSTRWYKKRSPLAAIRFQEEVFAVLDRILTEPFTFESFSKDERRAVLQVFPFKIVFREHDSTIYVLAIAHSKRRDGYWRRRSVA